MSVASDGTEGGNNSFSASTSADGRYVAFESGASDLVEGDTNGSQDVFVRDRRTGTTERVSVKGDGTEANDWSQNASISADGRYVAFESEASNLVDSDANGLQDIFVRDRKTGVTQLVSVATDGAESNDHSFAPSISADGLYVAFASWASNLVDPGPNDHFSHIFVRDRKTGVTEWISVPRDGADENGSSFAPSISPDGLYVAFESDDSSLVEAHINGFQQIFVRDRKTGVTELVSVASDGTGANGTSSDASISRDGLYVAFASWAPNLIFGDPLNRILGDTNGTDDVFVRDRDGRATERVSVASDGSEGNGSSFAPSISGDGLYVAFKSGASNLVAGDTNGYEDIFLHDRATPATRRLSVAADGTQGNRDSESPSISTDGLHVAFDSEASNLICGDRNGATDIFVRAPRLDGFDRDGCADPAVFRPSNSSWYFEDGASFKYGTSGDVPVVGDWDGDGDVDAAVFRPKDPRFAGASGWYFRGIGRFSLGQPADVPVPGDWDGDGVWDPAVFRPSNSSWYLEDGASFKYGTSGDVPVVGDWDGDGDVDAAVFRPKDPRFAGASGWYFRGIGRFSLGQPADVPVPGDWDGDGAWDPAVFRPSNSTWYFEDGSSFKYGITGDMPVVADWDGDGDIDAGVFRPNDPRFGGASGWYLRGVRRLSLGAVGDQPLALLPSVLQVYYPAS